MKLVALVGVAAALQAPRCSRTQRTKLSATRDDAQRRRLLVGGGGAVLLSPLQKALALPAAAAPRVVCDGFAVAATDDRKYRLVELASGMRVLLVSDARAESAAAAVDVHVGHMSDPAGYPGLAHFCEHMLFLGSEKFPGEDDWERFVSDSGGSSNAYTDTEDTCYFWELPDAAKLGAALTRWGPFFASPLFAADATRREVEAINSEHSKNLKSDAFRVYQLEKSLFPAAHPFSKFGTGNRTTLRPPDGTGEPPRGALVDFYGEHYVGDRMAGVVCGREPLDALTKLADRAFAGVRKRDTPQTRVASLPSASWLAVDPAPDTRDGALVVSSISSQRSLTLKWIVPFEGEDAAAVQASRLRDRFAKPDLFLSHVLGHEGPQSLLADLRRRGLAVGLGAGGGEDTDQFKSLDVGVDLTPKGLKEWRRVAKICLAYVAGLRAAKRWPDHVFDETATMANLAWTWGDTPELNALATGLAPKLQTVAYSGDATDVADVLRLDRAPRARSNDDRRADVRRVLDELARIAPLVTVLAPEPEIDGGVTGGAKRRTEPIYGTAYYRAPFAADASPPTSDLFPVPNAYVPTRALAPLHPRKRRVALSDLGPPSAYAETDAWRLWHKEDEIFGLPRAAVLVLVRSGAFGYTARDAVYARVWRSLVNDALRDADYDSGAASYDAALAGLEWTLSSGPRGVALTFGGFDDKLGAFATQTAKALRNLDAVDYASRDGGAPLQRVVDAVDREVARDAVAPPSARSVSELGLLTETPKFDVPALKKALDAVSLKGLRSWLDDKGGVWGSGGDVEVLAQGNLRKSDAAKLSGELRDVLRLSKTDASTDALLGVLEVPARDKGVLVKRTKAPQADESNYAALLSFQTGTGPDARARTLALNAVLEAPFYDELRTKKQLGYVVQSAARARENCSSLVFLAQSNKDDAESRAPDDLYGYMKSFLATSAPEALAALDAAKLGSVADGLARQLEETPKTLAADVGPHWEEIVAGTADWGKRRALAKALRALTPDDVRTFFDTRIAAGAERRPLLVLVDKGAPKAPAAPSLGADDGDVPAGYAASRPLYNKT